MPWLGKAAMRAHCDTQGRHFPGKFQARLLQCGVIEVTVKISSLNSWTVNEEHTGLAPKAYRENPAKESS